MNWIDSLLLNDNVFKDYVFEDLPKEMKCVSKINIFVGANNSGKSRFMRQIASLENMPFRPCHEVKQLNELNEEVRTYYASLLSSKGWTEVGGVNNILSGLTSFDEVYDTTELFSALDGFFDLVFGGEKMKYLHGNTWYENNNAVNEIRQWFNATHGKYKEHKKNIPGRIEFKKLYIPSLRGLRTFPGIKDCYLDRTKRDYFAHNNVDIFTGLSLCNDIRDLLLGDLRDREAVREFQDFLSESFFEGEPVALIPRKDSDVIFVKIGEEEEFPIYDLGDGIQSIIVLTFPLFKNKDERMLVFIEEPEIYMHPGLQRILLNTLMEFTDHQYFFTTHSNHFLDLTLDYGNISIYTFSKKLKTDSSGEARAAFNINNVSSEENPALELLGVKNSSVFLSNCTIWVEGITDRYYIEHYLELYRRHIESKGNIVPLELKEDLHYSFVEYSGGNITHWSFLDEESGVDVDRLCGRLFLVADLDDPSHKGKAVRRRKLKKKLGKRFYSLKCREIENLITPKALRSVLSEYEGSDEHIPAIVYEEYKDKPLGHYIDKDLLKRRRRRQGKYSRSSGTITDKINFCKKAIGSMDEFNSLSTEAKSMTKKIYEFIESNNFS